MRRLFLALLLLGILPAIGCKSDPAEPATARQAVDTSLDRSPNAIWSD